MEIAGLLLISIAMLLLAYNSKNNWFKMLYLGVSLLMFIIASRVMTYSIGYLSVLFLVTVWVFITVVFVIFVLVFIDNFKYALQLLKRVSAR